MFRPAATGTALGACLLSFALGAAPAPAATRTFSPVAQKRGVLVYELAGVKPAAVRSAHLSSGKRRATVTARKVRAAARAGRLRVGAPRWARGRRGARAASSSPKLVVVTTCSNAGTEYRRIET